MGLSLEQIARLTNKPLPEQHEAIIAKVDECMAIASRYFTDRNNLITPTVSYDVKGTVAGKASPAHIHLNLDLLFSNWDDMLNSTVPHEVAHCIQRQIWPHSQAHGHEWKHVMHVLGLPAKRCHSYDVKPARVHPRPHEYACLCRTFKLTNLIHKRIQNGQRRHCTVCNCDLVYSHSEG